MKRWQRITRALATAAAALAATALSAAAADKPALLPGGQLDTSLPGLDVYIGTPKEADPGDSPACRHLKAYFDMEAQKRYDELPTLFREDAVFLDPIRKSLTGRLDINDFYKHAISKINPSIIPVSYAGRGMDCFVETAVLWTINGEPRWVFSAADHITIDSEGKIILFIGFVRPPQVAATPPVVGHLGWAAH